MVFKRFLWLFLVLTTVVCGQVQAQRFVCMESTQGNWCVELQWTAAPKSVANFLQYVKGGYYTNDLVHRSAKDFVIQGGGFTISEANAISTVSTFAPVALEYSLPNARGTMAMARTSDLNSATSQWFINTVDNTTTLGPSNGGGYAVFATVVQGMEVIDKIAALKLLNASSVNSAWSTLPLDPPAGVTSIPIPIPRTYYVLINRAYATDVLPGIAAYHCSERIANETLSEVCSGAVSFPVSAVGLGTYDATLQIVSDNPKVVLTVKSLKQLTALPSSYATYDPATKLLQIPSVRIGNTIFTDLALKMTNDATLEFTLQTFTHQ